MGSSAKFPGSGGAGLASFDGEVLGSASCPLPNSGSHGSPLSPTSFDLYNK